MGRRNIPTACTSCARAGKPLALRFTSSAISTPWAAAKVIVPGCWCFSRMAVLMPQHRGGAPMGLCLCCGGTFPVRV